MREIIKRFGQVVKGVLTGFDRIVFKGMVMPLAYAAGAMKFCGRRGILNKDFKSWMVEHSEALDAGIDAYARRETGQGICRLSTWKHDKEELARNEQQRTGIKSGLIGVWSCNETGRSYRAHFSRELGYPELRPYTQFCKHVYLYFDDPQYGFMNIRIQTWFPYAIQICMNGREWLRREMERSKVAFVCKGNKFLHVGSYDLAQRFLDAQMDSRWAAILNSFLGVAFPTMRETLGPHLDYYWTLWQSEWATDLIFDRPETLTPVTANLMRHAFMTGTPTHVLRYMDRPLTQADRPHKRNANEVMSRFKDFHEGIRVRHWVDQNSIKAYNEQNVLRFEMTMNTPAMFQVYRRRQKDPVTAPKKLHNLRKGVADIPLRAQISQEINNRFMDDVAAFSDETPFRQVLASLTQPLSRDSRRIRGLEPVGKDRELLEALSDPAFSLSGITNKALRRILKTKVWGRGRTDKQLSAKISRHLRMLRHHGLIRKTTNRLQYHLTAKGRQLVTALSSALAASTRKLMEMAA